MARTYLVRGMLAGLLAGLCAVAFAKAVAEPQISKAESFERTLDVQLARPLAKPLVSRDLQDTVGLGVGVVVAGVALGGLFGLAFAGAYRRVGQAGPRTTAAVLAASAFTGVFLVPFLKYPANPPSVGNADTIGRRTTLYFLAVVVGLLAVALAAMVHRLMLRRQSSGNAALVAGAVFVVVVTFAYVVMPGIDEVPFGFPASVLWKFRLASAGTQLTLWGILGLSFGWLTERAENARLHAGGRPIRDVPADIDSSSGNAARAG
jgi:predicted cobalt transporter CbtA